MDSGGTYQVLGFCSFSYFRLTNPGRWVMSSAPASDHKPILLSTHYLANNSSTGTGVRPDTSLNMLKSLGKEQKETVSNTLCCVENGIILFPLLLVSSMVDTLLSANRNYLNPLNNLLDGNHYC